MKTKQEILHSIQHELIVSCQALPDEPLHSPYIMARMAYAAMMGGAKGIRANSIEDIKEIKRTVNLPIIGIIKHVYSKSEVFITPTQKEIDLLYREGVDIIAIDATNRLRPDGKVISEVFPAIRKQYSDQLFMADCSTYEEGKQAYELGFDCLGTTLSGYTEYTQGTELPDKVLIEKLVRDFPIPVIAEGGIWTPEELKCVFELGAYSAVVGTAITRPMNITKRFVEAMKSNG
ncbi:N-acetylmannosamine-6-phosphate 2-epimerase [Psychrobacillus sp. AK 1817]|uniref:N-acetylmannosamine-6-phosphate 2-epimerase n=1 Tax=Psychrobacillus sp. AK 1817 TaxID=2303505 RepID=UPI0012481A05|nr:N-acetylmannosamine-6-phosphate 2-epimerase [Psychrobacillus sp. AK 1817]QEY19212.1 N-acetylmannosamine-6-phosphate 2-epimerase [Psychrobacillus sp. AK 1817]QEY22833.1 N-acetylmannosamine-6-phosphate 2-epimerase [Psychrobacillus sp. AK 1817]